MSPVELEGSDEEHYQQECQKECEGVGHSATPRSHRWGVSEGGQVSELWEGGQDRPVSNSHRAGSIEQ